MIEADPATAVETADHRENQALLGRHDHVAECETSAVDAPDLAVAFDLADLADGISLRWWDPAGIETEVKPDGSPVTSADVAVEEAILEAITQRLPGDGFVGEEVGARSSANGRRWIVDGIDGTWFFAAGATTWGTLIALEIQGEVTVAVASSPATPQRWWATRGGGTWTSTKTNGQVRLAVSSCLLARPDRFVVLPSHRLLAPAHRAVIERLAGGRPADWPWSHPLAVASGSAEVSVWFSGGIWDLAAPSLLVEEAGGRFSDHWGQPRLDTRTAIFSNGSMHDEVQAALAQLSPPPDPR